MKRNKGALEAWILSHLTTGQTAVDVGANHGILTEVMRRAVGPTGRVIAVEPHPGYVEELSRIAEPHLVALSDHAGTRTLYDAQEQSSFYQATIEPGRMDGAIDVPVTTLDALVDRADLVKIDAQGEDAAILRGAWHLLRQCPAWVVEVWPVGLTCAGDTPASLWAVLREAGLTVCWTEGDPVTDESIAEWARDGGPKFVNWIATR